MHGLKIYSVRLVIENCLGLCWFLDGTEGKSLSGFNQENMNFNPVFIPIHSFKIKQIIISERFNIDNTVLAMAPSNAVSNVAEKYAPLLYILTSTKDLSVLWICQF